MNQSLGSVDPERRAHLSLTIFNTPVVREVLCGMSWVLLKLLGWRVEGTLPKSRRFVLIAAPHTSNWDAFYMIMVAFVFRVNLRWVGKPSLFSFPLGIFMRFIGGIPVGHSHGEHTVDKGVEVIKDMPEIVLAIPPEGSRAKVRYWKTGFYYVALGAQIPVVLGYLDFDKKRTGVGPAVMPSGNIDQDFDLIKGFYKPFKGKYPGETSSTRLVKD